MRVPLERFYTYSRASDSNNRMHDNATLAVRALRRASSPSQEARQKKRMASFAQSC